MRKGYFALIFRPFPVSEWADSITFPDFRNPKQANGVLLVRIGKIQISGRHDDDTASNEERSARNLRLGHV